MSDDDQAMLDLGVDIEVEKAKKAWVAWIDPKVMEAKIREFVTNTLPNVDVANTPFDEWWVPPHVHDIGDAIDDKFLDSQEMITAENAEVIDQLVRFVGELFVRHAGGRWVNQDAPGTPVYELIGPAISFRHENMEPRAVQLVDWVMSEGWTGFWMTLYGMGLDWKEWKTAHDPDQ
jgi:hypothetical protein